jgi:hypothetical protein
VDSDCEEDEDDDEGGELDMEEDDDDRGSCEGLDEDDVLAFDEEEDGEVLCSSPRRIRLLR